MKQGQNILIPKNLPIQSSSLNSFGTVEAVSATSCFSAINAANLSPTRIIELTRRPERDVFAAAVSSRKVLGLREVRVVEYGGYMGEGVRSIDERKGLGEDNGFIEAGKTVTLLVFGVKS